MVSERDTVTTRGLAFIILTISWVFILFGWVCIIVTLKEILEIFESLVIKLALTVTYIILDVFYRKRIKKIILALVLLSSSL